MKNQDKILSERNLEIYNEFLTGKYVLRELAVMFNLDPKQISNILTRFLKKK